MHHRFWLIALFISPIYGFSQASFTHGTALAIERDDDQIAVAADSRVTDNTFQTLPSTCKIGSAGKWHFSMNGLAATKKVEFFAGVKMALSDQEKMTEGTGAIIAAITPVLNEAVQLYPAVREYGLSHFEMLGVSFFGLEQKKLKLTSITFHLTDSGVVPIQHTCPGDCAPTNRAVIVVPGSDLGKFNLSAAPLTAVREFVQMEIEQNKTEVGPPIQLLQIDRHGVATWVEKPEICKDE